MPMDGSVLLQAVANSERDSVTFAPPKNWSGQRTIDRHCRTSCSGDVDRQLADVQIKIGACQHIRLARAGQGPDRRAPHAQSTK
ncbi:hypothetical protein D3C77_237530 [compost metagenome]